MDHLTSKSTLSPTSGSYFWWIYLWLQDICLPSLGEVFDKNTPPHFNCWVEKAIPSVVRV